MNFLIVKTSSIGDIIHTFPVVQYLKARSPNCTIDWVVEEEYASLVRSHPDVATVYTVGSRRWRRHLFKKKSYQELIQFISLFKKKPYDAVFDLQGNTKSAFLTQIAKSSHKVGFGWNSSPEWPNYFVTRQRFEVSQGLPIQQRYLSVVQQFFNDETPFIPQGIELNLTEHETEELKRYPKQNGPSVMVAFASRWENKCLAQETLTAFLKDLYAEEKCCFYFVSGNREEKEEADQLAQQFPESLSLQGLSFPLWQRIMGQMDLVIAVDSAALALCGTTSTPSFSFFGPTKASVYKPIGAQHHHYQGTCPYQVNFAARCPRLRTCPTGACLKSATAESLQKALSGDCTT